MDLNRQHRFNTSAGPHHAPREALPNTPPAEYPVRFIAYYLPQFHTTAENDAWWGKGFTEWTNVTKALPGYEGHYQPRLPADLGFYDLSTVKAIEQQVELAKLGGVYGFCIHDYWFAGRKILETPLNLILANPQIDIPFCLNWANENWSRRWDGFDQQLLLEQKHSPEDDLAYAESLKAAFQDERYIRINGRPLLMLYRPSLMPDARATIARWREFFQAAGLGDPYMVMPQVDGDEDPGEFDMDAVAGFPPHKVGWHMPDLAPHVRRFDWKFTGAVRSYEAMAEFEKASRPDHYRLLPGVCPDWDNEPRQPQRGFSFHGSTPGRYGDWLADAAAFAGGHADPDERIVFINAWNEWAEGAYLEPDRHNGFAYLAQTRQVLDAIGAHAGDQSRRQTQQPAPALERRLFGSMSLIGRIRSRLARLMDDIDD